MAITFAIRGTSVDARYSKSGKSPAVTFLNNSGAVGGWSRVGTAQPGINGVSSIDMYGTGFASPGGNFRALTYPGNLNTPGDRARSVLIRFRMNDLGINYALFSMMGYNPIAINSIGATLLTSGEVRIDIANDLAATYTVTTSGAGITSGAWYDLLISWDGTTTANGVKAFLNGSSILSATSSRALITPFTAADRAQTTKIILGVSPIATRFSSQWVDEFVVWDTAMTSATVDLESGSGSLSGASRTSYVAVAEYDGITWPTESQVLSPITWNQYGVEKIGNVTLPLVSDVSVGGFFGPNSSIEGDLILPGDNEVLSGVPFGSQGMTTGRVVLPIEDDVRQGVGFGDFTPDGYQYTGNNVLPTEDNVLAGVYYGSSESEFEGNVLLPGDNEVLFGVPYGPLGQNEGDVLLPVEDDVRDGSGYGVFSPDGFSMTGNLSLPQEIEVLDGIGFGSLSEEFVGSLVLPEQEDVLDGVGFGDGLTGNVVLPQPTDVKEGVIFGPDNSLTGELILAGDLAETGMIVILPEDQDLIVISDCFCDESLVCILEENTDLFVVVEEKVC